MRMSCFYVYMLYDAHYLDTEVFVIALHKLYLFYLSGNVFYKMYHKFWRNLNISINIEIYTICKMWKNAIYMHNYNLWILLINTLSTFTYWSNLSSNCSHEHYFCRSLYRHRSEVQTSAADWATLCYRRVLNNRHQATPDRSMTGLW